MNRLKGKHGFFIKVFDLAKAHDQVSQGFVHKVLEDIGFPDKLI